MNPSAESRVAHPYSKVPSASELILDSCRKISSSLIKSVFLAAGLLSLCVNTHGQTQQPFLVAIPAGVPAGSNLGATTFTRDDTTGALTLVPNAAVTFAHPCYPFVLGFKELFLFGFCGDGLSMYTLDGLAGLIAEVPASPFTASTGSSAVAIAPESTGQYVYLLKANFSGANSSQNLVLDTFKIDPQTPALVVTSSQALPFVGGFVGAGGVVDPNGHGFAVLLNQDQGGAQPVPVVYMVTFDPSSGLALLPAAGVAMAGTNAGSLHIAPKGQFMAVNFGANSEFLTVLQLSTSNFQVAASNSLNVGTVPFSDRAIFFDPSGTLAYVQSLNPNFSGTGDYTNYPVFDLATLTELPSSPVTFAQGNQIGCGVLDPFGPFVYCENTTGPNNDVFAGIAAYQVDPVTGVPIAVPNSPFAANLAIFPGVLTATASQQGGSTPALGWSPSNLTFSSTTTGQSSGPQIITLKNVGSLPVTFSSVAISGPNAADFSKSDQCSTMVVLQPSVTCTISITYAPANPGTSQAAVVVSDDAAGSPQDISLSGTAVAAVGAVSLNPSGTLNFPGTTEGTSSVPQNVTLTNSGSGTLHVTNVTVTGLNASDFVPGTSNCVGTVAPSANCTIPLTFTPLATGIRTATLEITDDATGSPQSLTLNGTSAVAVSLGPAPNGSTSASVSPGQTAQYNLEITPGSGYSGTVALACTGAPLGANCQLPSTVQVSNGNPALFTVMVTTSGGSSAALPFVRIPLWTPLSARRGAPVFATILAALLLLVLRRHVPATPRRARLAFSGAFAALIFVALVYCAGCGGGSSAITTQPPPPPPPPPPPIITPQGTSTITITPTASSPSGKPLQLQPLQLTLTVN